MSGQPSPLKSADAAASEAVRLQLSGLIETLNQVWRAIDLALVPDLGAGRRRNRFIIQTNRSDSSLVHRHHHGRGCLGRRHSPDSLLRNPTDPSARLTLTWKIKE